MDMVNILELNSCRVSIYDPYILPEEGNNFITNPFKMSTKYDAIVVAVAHDEFLKYSSDDFSVLSKEKLVLLDIKGIYKGSHWKL